jgi:Tfp pilus assembly protein PilO
MTKFIMPIILTGIAVTFFFVVTNPMYSGATGITALQTQIDSYNQALNTSTQLKNERDQLTAIDNSIDPDNLAKLQKLLPDDVNNIRLILEIQQIASTYGMQISDVKYDTSTTTPATTTDTSSVAGGANIQQNSQGQDYGIFNLGFSTSGTYDNFTAFTRGLETNLRIVDISSINLSSTAGTTTGTQTSASPSYKYDFNIQTYWLKS